MEQPGSESGLVESTLEVGCPVWNGIAHDPAILTAVRGIALLAVGLGWSSLLAEEGVKGPDSFGTRGAPEAELVDEDEQYAPPQQVYAFNPVQAKNELKVGNYYAKKGSYRAAAGRYVEATRWDPGFGEAWRRLGMAREKLDQPAEAIAAYSRYLAIEPDGPKARGIRRSLGALRKAMEELPISAGP